MPAPFPKVLGEGVLGQTAVRLNQALIAVAPTLFDDIYIEAMMPDVDFVLASTKQASVERGRNLVSRGRG